MAHVRQKRGFQPHIRLCGRHRLPQRRLGPFVFRDVTDDANGRMLLVQRDHRQRQLDRELGAVLPLGGELRDFTNHRAGAGLPELREPLCGGFAETLRHDQRMESAADRLSLGVTEEPLGRPVPKKDLIISVEHDNGVQGGVRERPEFLIALLQSLFHLLTVCDVAGYSKGANNLPMGIPQRHLCRRDPGVRATLPGLSLFLVNHRPAGLHDALLILKRLACVLVGEQVEIRLPHHGGGLHPMAAAFGPADRDESRVAVFEIYVVRDALHQRAQKRPLLLQDLRGMLCCHVH